MYHAAGRTHEAFDAKAFASIRGLRREQTVVASSFPLLLLHNPVLRCFAAVAFLFILLCFVPGSINNIWVSYKVWSSFYGGGKI